MNQLNAHDVVYGDRHQFSISNGEINVKEAIATISSHASVVHPSSSISIADKSCMTAEKKFTMKIVYSKGVVIKKKTVCYA